MIALLQYNLISRCLFLNRTRNVYRHVRLSWQTQCRGEVSLVVKCGGNCTPAYVVSYDLVEFLSYLCYRHFASSSYRYFASSSRSERQYIAWGRKPQDHEQKTFRAREAGDSRVVLGRSPASRARIFLIWKAKGRHRPHTVTPKRVLSDTP